MKTGRRAICWVAVCAVLMILGGVAIRAAADGRDWATPDALGDVAVSFDGKVIFYGNADAMERGDLTFISTRTGGLAFDNALSLLVANTNTGAPSPPTNQNHLVRFSAELTSVANPTHPTSTIPTQASPRSIAFSGNNTLYVASPGSPATVRRYSYISQTQFALSATFTIPTDSTACIGIDLAPDETPNQPGGPNRPGGERLYYVAGGRQVRSVADVDSIPDLTVVPIDSVSVFATLPNPGTACGLRLLPPVDARCAALDAPSECLSTPTLVPTVPTPVVGGAIVADGRNIKRLDSSGAVVEPFQAGSGQESQKNWIDVALDPNRQDFWGVDAGFSRLAKFRMKGANPMLPIQLASVPRGVAVNGELRAAQTVRIVDLSANTAGRATFLEGTTSAHSWSGKVPVSAFFAVQAIETCYIPDPPPPGDPDPPPPLSCASTLDIRPRLHNFDSTATPKQYSHVTKRQYTGRAVFYREILRTTIDLPCLVGTPDDQCLDVGVFFPGPTDLSAGKTCEVNGTPPAGTALLRDPWPHDFFEIDRTLAFYGGDDGGITRTRTNDTIVVDRSDQRYYMQLIKPTPLTVGQIGSAMQVAVEVRDPRPPAACGTVPGLNESLVLSVTDITDGPDKGKPLGDSENIFGVLDGNGLTWASTANQYRTNLLIDSKFTAKHKYRVCVAAPAGQTTDGMPAAGEVCVDIIAKLGTAKN